MDYSILNYLWFFVIYAFLGWCIEVAFHVVTSGKFINRGFLNGPVTPIYGFGMIILIFVLDPFMENSILLFIGSFLLTSLLEFLTGFVLEKLFDTKWWDYSDLPFNIKGYISLSFSLVWGLAAVFVLNIVHPSIYKFISIFDNTIGNILLSLLLFYFLIDFIITALALMEINRHVKVLDDIGERLRYYSEDIGENIYKGMTGAINTKDHIQDKIEDSKSEIEIARNKRKLEIAKLYKEYEDLMERKNFVHRRLEKSFPHIRKRISQLKDDDRFN